MINRCASSSQNVILTKAKFMRFHPCLHSRQASVCADCAENRYKEVITTNNLGRGCFGEASRDGHSGLHQAGVELHLRWHKEGLRLSWHLLLDLILTSSSVVAKSNFQLTLFIHVQHFLFQLKGFDFIWLPNKMSIWCYTSYTMCKKNNNNNNQQTKLTMCDMAGL